MNNNTYVSMEINFMERFLMADRLIKNMSKDFF